MALFNFRFEYFIELFLFIYLSFLSLSCREAGRDAELWILICPRNQEQKGNLLDIHCEQHQRNAPTKLNISIGKKEKRRNRVEDSWVCMGAAAQQSLPPPSPLLSFYFIIWRWGIFAYEIFDFLGCPGRIPHLRHNALFRNEECLLLCKGVDQSSYITRADPLLSFLAS